MNNPHLFLHMALQSSGELLEGRLLLMEGPKIIKRYRVTTGCPGWQQWDDQDKLARGPIPRCDLVGIDHYEVVTKADYVPEVIGIEGNFYEILPTEVSIYGIARSHFGIHRDANVPGSSGCPVLTTQNGWADFQKQMAEINKEYERIPLQVDYSF